MDERTIFLEALDKPLEVRSAWLDEVCGGSTPLRRRIELLVRKHQQADNFLEEPAPEIEATQAPSALRADVAAVALEANGDPAFRPNQAVAIGSANQSVLESLGQTVDSVPRIVLRDVGEQWSDPVVRPTSVEMPARDIDGRYQLQGEIARGGMGAIIKARDTDLGRDLAVKVLLDAHRDRPEVIQRFVEEAQIGGQLQHPGIAPVYELGQCSDRRPFFSMKLVKGQTLSTLLADRADPSQDRGKFLGIFEQICQTMAYAHSRGVIHRDLKPANVMVGAFGEVQVMDWGLAKVLAAGGVADEKKEQQTSQHQSVIQTLRSAGSDTPAGYGSETQMGSVMGTPAYMAPEQALGEVDRLDERSDVFGLGAILCVVLTGQPPYVGEDATEVFRQATRGRLAECFARLDACGADSDLIDLAKHCLEVEPSDRPRNAGVLADRISHHLESVETRLRETEIERAAQAARAVEERKRLRVTLALAASVLLLIGLAGGGWMWVGQQQAERQKVATDRVNKALNDAKLHEGLAASRELDIQLQELEEAVRHAERARDVAQEGVVDEALRENATQLLADLKKREANVRVLDKQAKADREFQTALEQIRLGQADQGQTLSRQAGSFAFSIAAADKQYEKAFREAGFAVMAMDISESAARIRKSAIRESIVAALDNWARSISAVGETSRTERQFDRFAEVGEYVAAADLGVRLAERNSNPFFGMRVATVLALVGDIDAYKTHCRRMLERLATARNQDLAHRTCVYKGALLVPKGIDLTLLPDKPLFTSLTAETPEWLSPWAWNVRAMLAYRAGEASAALDYVRKSQQSKPNKFAEALNVAVRALANRQLGHTAEARSDVQEASRMIDELRRNEPWHIDLLIAEIMLREAQAKLMGSSLAHTAGGAKQLTRRERLLAVADLADKNPWRKRLRAALRDNEIAAVKRLVTSDETRRQSPELVAWLGAVLREAGELETSVDLLRKSQHDHSGDFWLNYELARTLSHLGEAPQAVEFSRAALATKPNSLGAWLLLADALADAGRDDDYYPVYRQVLRQMPLGIGNARALWDAGRTPRALEERERSIALAHGYTQEFPEDAKGHLLFAMNVSRDGERFDESVAALRRVAELKLDNLQSYSWFCTFLGNMLTFQNKPSKAIEAYRLGVEFNPDDAVEWLRLAPAIAAAGDRDAYREFCREMVERFGNSQQVGDASKTCKACMLLPDGIDPAALPIEAIEKGLDDSTLPNRMRVWSWSTRALWAYRRGDPQAAVLYVGKSEEEETANEFAHALNLTIRALARQQLGQLDEAREAIAGAAKAIDSLRRGPARANDRVYHDVFIPLVLLREAKSRVNESADAAN